MLDKTIHIQTRGKVIHVNQFGELFVHQIVVTRKDFKLVPIFSFDFGNPESAMVVAALITRASTEVKKDKIIFHARAKQRKEKKHASTKNKHLDNLSKEKLDSDSDERDDQEERRSSDGKRIGVTSKK